MREDWEQAIRRDDAATLARLLEEGADIDARDAHGQTGVMLAALSAAARAAAFLAERGADLDHTAKYRLSALMLAVVRNQPAIVRALVAAGADLTIRGSGAPGFHEKTALDLAEAAGYGEIAAILREAEHGKNQAPCGDDPPSPVLPGRPS
jgi:ankyrin repeat protein